MPSYKSSDRVENIQVSLIKQMPMMAYRLVQKGLWAAEDVLSLGQGIPSMPTPRYITDSLIRSLQTDSNIGKYSLQPGLPALKTAIAKTISARTGRKVHPDKELFVSVGAMEALSIAFQVLLNKGDEVILADPGYASHIEQVLLAEGKPVFVPLEAGNNWQFNIERLREKITPRTKAIVVCNPANPTGMCLSADNLNEIIKVAIEKDIFIIGDETYRYLVFDNKPFKSLLDFPAIQDRLIYTYSFSKEFAMTGYRIGYMYAPEPIIDACLKVHDAFAICAPTISQYAALAALTEATPENSTDMVGIFQARRDLMCTRLDRLAQMFSYTKPDGAYFILVKYAYRNMSSFDFAKKLLEEAGIITIPGSGFGPQGEGYIRMSFCGTEDDIHRAFDRMESWVKGLALA